MHVDPIKPSTQPSKQVPLVWWHWPTWAQFPHGWEQLSPNVPLSQAMICNKKIMLRSTKNKKVSFTLNVVSKYATSACILPHQTNGKWLHCIEE